jgi:hypothetical protein
MTRAGNVQPCSGPPGLHNGTRPQTGEGNLTCFYWCECPQGMAFREQAGGQLDAADRARAGRDRPHPRARIRDIAATADLSQRTVQAIIADLEAAGYLTRTRPGRRTVYTIHPGRPFRHPAQDGHRISPLLERLAARGRPRDAAISQPVPAGTTLPRPADSLADPRRRRARTASGFKGLRTGALPPLAVPLLVEPRTRPVVHTACLGHTPAAARRHDPRSTSSVWLIRANCARSDPVVATFPRHRRRHRTARTYANTPAATGRGAARPTVLPWPIL